MLSSTETSWLERALYIQALHSGPAIYQCVTAGELFNSSEFVLLPVKWGNIVPTSYVVRLNSVKHLEQKTEYMLAIIIIISVVMNRWGGQFPAAAEASSW